MNEADPSEQPEPIGGRSLSRPERGDSEECQWKFAKLVIE